MKRLYTHLFFLMVCLCVLGDETSPEIHEIIADSTKIISSVEIDSLQDDNNRDFSDGIAIGNYFLNYGKIPVNVVVSTFQFKDPQSNRKKALFAGALIFAFAIDQPVRDFVQDEIYSGSNVISETLRRAGHRKYVFPAFAAAYGLSIVLRNRYYHDTVLLTFQSLIVTQLFTEVTKFCVGRARPRNSSDDPFHREQGGVSFFSGHASGAWAVMTVVARRYERLKWGAYGLALAIAAARVYEDAHWTSDVLMGSIAGYAIANITLRLNDVIGRPIMVAPMIDSEKNGVIVYYNF